MKPYRSRTGIRDDNKRRRQETIWKEQKAQIMYEYLKSLIVSSKDFDLKIRVIHVHKESLKLIEQFKENAHTMLVFTRLSYDRTSPSSYAVKEVDVKEDPTSPGSNSAWTLMVCVL